MTAEAPKPNEKKSQEPRSILDEVQARFRSEPWNNPGGRFGYIDLTPRELPDLYGSRHDAAERAHDEALDALSEQAFKLAQDALEESPQR